MPMKTKIIGTRVPVVLYQQLEKCAGDNRTLGDVVKEALERYCFPSGSKPVVDRLNTDNPKSAGVRESNKQEKATLESYANYLKNKQQVKERSDDFPV